ncbi:MAG: metal ABC transporter permease [Limisphaerales bacterium]
MTWSSIDTWITVTAVITAMACVIPGVFLLLSRQSMMSHGVAHAVLPGIVISFLIMHERHMLAMLIGAILAAVLTGVLTRFFQNFGKVEPGAALGIAFTSLFALGLVLVRTFADFAHIEPSHVLFGSLEMSVLGDGTPPGVTIRSGIILLCNLLLTVLFFKELKIATFDPELSASLGFHPQWMQYGIMSVTATTAVIAFESVGSILVIAMMIAPPATALLLTKDLKKLILLSLIIAAGTATLGHVLSIRGFGAISSGLFRIDAYGSTNTAGGIAVVSGLVFLVVLFLKRQRQVEV